MIDIPQCTICLKRISVPNRVVIRGMALEVCKDCSKYGREIEVTEVDDFIHYYPPLGVGVKVGKISGE